MLLILTSKKILVIPVLLKYFKYIKNVINSNIQQYNSSSYSRNYKRMYSPQAMLKTLLFNIIGNLVFPVLLKGPY